MPDPVSMYFPNAGQYVFRTGWGPDEQYLFFGAGPWGASHGKQDALNIYTAFGDHLLIRNAGRASYKGLGNTPHAGKSLGFNVLSPDWAQENSTPHWEQEKLIGFNPPERRFVNNARFDYGEGAYNYGWYKPGEHIQGKWLRQVIFVKGADPKVDGYFIVVDTVEPKDNRERTWRLPWHLQPDIIGVDEDILAVRAEDNGAAMQILGVDPTGEMTLEIIEGQEEPELLGWRVHGDDAKPWPVPTYAWTSNGIFSRAWIIQMQASSSQWPVESVTANPGTAPGEISFVVKRVNGGVDHVLRRFPGAPATTLDGEKVEGDFAIVSRNADGAITGRLDVTGGEESVAKPSGIAQAAAQPTASKRLGRDDTVPAAAGAAIAVANASFEEPVLDVERGIFEGWEFSSVAGTGTWPAARANTEGEPDGSNGTILRIYRGHLLSTDDAFLQSVWRRTKQAMEYQIGRYDANEDGTLEGGQHNTLDADWYGRISFAPVIRPDDFAAPFLAGTEWGTLRQQRKDGSQAGSTLTIRLDNKLDLGAGQSLNVKILPS